MTRKVFHDRNGILVLGNDPTTTAAVFGPMGMTFMLSKVGFSIRTEYVESYKADLRAEGEWTDAMIAAHVARVNAGGQKLAYRVATKDFVVGGSYSASARCAAARDLICERAARSDGNASNLVLWIIKQFGDILPRKRVKPSPLFCQILTDYSSSGGAGGALEVNGISPTGPAHFDLSDTPLAAVLSIEFYYSAGYKMRLITADGLLVDMTFGSAVPAPVVWNGFITTDGGSAYGNGVARFSPSYMHEDHIPIFYPSRIENGGMFELDAATILSAMTTAMTTSTVAAVAAIGDYQNPKIDVGFCLTASDGVVRGQFKPVQPLFGAVPWTDEVSLAYDVSASWLADRYAAAAGTDAAMLEFVADLRVGPVGYRVIHGKVGPRGTDLAATKLFKDAQAAGENLREKEVDAEADKQGKKRKFSDLEAAARVSRQRHGVDIRSTVLPLAGVAVGSESYIISVQIAPSTGNTTDVVYTILGGHTADDVQYMLELDASCVVFAVTNGSTTPTVDDRLAARYPTVAGVGNLRLEGLCDTLFGISLSSAPISVASRQQLITEANVWSPTHYLTAYPSLHELTHTLELPFVLELVRWEQLRALTVGVAEVPARYAAWSS